MLHPRRSPSRAPEEILREPWLKKLVIASFFVGFLLVAVVTVSAVLEKRTDIVVIEALFAFLILACSFGVAFHRRRVVFWYALGIAATAILPNVSAWFTGGFQGSGGRSLWAFLAPLGVLVVWRNRAAFALLALFLAFQIALVDIPSPHASLSDPMRLIMGHIHIVGVFLGSFAVFAIFHWQVETQGEALQTQEIDRKTVELKSEILNVMSHEIRTPLNAIIGLLDLMSIDRMSPEQIENLRTIQFASGNLLLLVNDVLDYSKFQEGVLQLETIPFDAERVLRNTVLSQENIARGNDVELVGIWDKDSPCWVRGDPTRFAQILTNLVSNAVKFSPKGKVEIRGSWRDERLVLAVRDTGIGIAPDRQERIFQPFAQADVSTAREFGGTGLGLAIVKKIVQVSGGSIRLESALGRGTTFEVELPWTQAPSGAEAAAHRPLSPWKILLVDDNALNTRVAERLLQRLGQDVSSVPGGEEAIAWLETNSCDLIFMDLQMPGLDGFATTRSIRKRWGHEIQIVALSAEVMQHVQERVKLAGMQGFLAKPINAERLQLCVAERQCSTAA